MSEIHEITCINCPLGCRVTVETEDGQAVKVTGYGCKRGDAYARQECIRPMRMLTAAIPCLGSETPLSVRTSCPIPKDMVEECMAYLMTLKVSVPVRMGEVICPRVLGTEADIIATRDLK